MRAYQRGDIGPLRPNNGNPTSPPSTNQSGTQPLPHDELLALFQASSVMVKTNVGHGSGFFIDKKTVVTNRHVIDKASPDSIVITSKHLGSAPLKAKLIASSSQGEVGDADFAILHISNAPSTVKSVSISNNPMPLQNIVAVGYPDATIRTDANQRTPEMIFSIGVVSGLQPQPNGMIWVVHGADIAGGSSGGGLFDRCGHVLGVNTFVTSGRNQYENRSLYALASSSLRSFLDKQGHPYQKYDGQCAATTGN
jgi:S1-C subfamily serine protease